MIKKLSLSVLLLFSISTPTSGHATTNWSNLALCLMILGKDEAGRNWSNVAKVDGIIVGSVLTGMVLDSWTKNSWIKERARDYDDRYKSLAVLLGAALPAYWLLYRFCPKLTFDEIAASGAALGLAGESIGLVIQVINRLKQATTKVPDPQSEESAVTV